MRPQLLTPVLDKGKALKKRLYSQEGRVESFIELLLLLNKRWSLGNWERQIKSGGGLENQGKEKVFKDLHAFEV